MCIISAEVERVNSTKIFTSFNNNQTRQLTVYSNEVDTKEDENMMILPVPNPSSVEFVNLKSYTRFFDDVQRNFVKHKPVSAYAHLTRSLECSASLPGEAPPLPVFSVGSYVASIVPSVNDFHRLDKNTFVMESDLDSLLKKNYNEEFGYIVCKLKKGRHTYHPFAYTHGKHSCNLLFIPTLHYHPHSYGGTRMIEADWDHVIYSVGTDLDTTSYDEYIFRNADSIKYSKLPDDFSWMSEQKIKRWTKSGTGKNYDLWVAGNIKDPITQPRPRTPSPSRERKKASTYSYKFPMTEEGLRNLRRHFGNG